MHRILDYLSFSTKCNKICISIRAENLIGKRHWVENNLYEATIQHSSSSSRSYIVVAHMSGGTCSSQYVHGAKEERGVHSMIYKYINATQEIVN